MKEKKSSIKEDPGRNFKKSLIKKLEMDLSVRFQSRLEFGESPNWRKKSDLMTSRLLLTVPSNTVAATDLH